MLFFLGAVAAPLLLRAADPVNPILADTTPHQGDTVSELTHVDVVFDRNVAGVDQNDLLINGTASTNILFVSPREYIFYFPQPPAGDVKFEFAAAHGITDINDASKLFGGASWTNKLDTNVPPAQVVISEFLADNTTGVRDNEGNRSDFIELYNMSSDAVNLNGWYLTDESTNLTKWRFPEVSINAGAYMLIWASARDLTDPARPLHTSFKLSKESGYLALVNSNKTVVSAFAPYPDQRSNVSFGRDKVDPSLTGFYSTPTPGAANSVSGASFAPDPVISVKGGIFLTGQVVRVKISAPYGEIRYTLDASIPTQVSVASQIYTNEITITNNAVLSARVFVPGLLPGAIVAENFTFVSGTITNFSSNLPVIVIDTGGKTIPDSVRIRTFIETFEPKDAGRTRIQNPTLSTAARMEIRGQTSAGFAKVPWNLETDDIYGKDLDQSLLGLPPESEWALSNPYSDKCLMNNVLTFELNRKMGHYAPRTVFVEVFIKNRARALSYPEDYKGVYVLMEKLRIDKNRVNIQEMGSGDTNEPAITGGYIIKKDKDSPGDVNFSTLSLGGFSGQNLKYHQPAPRYINVPQRNWIRNYIMNFERTLYPTDWLTRTGTNHYSSYIDVDSFVDYHWIVEYTKQIDGYRLSNYMSKDRGGKLKMEPIWDWNLAWGNADYYEAALTNRWYWNIIDANDHIWLHRLITGITTVTTNTSKGDPDFNQKIVDRWGTLRTNILNSTNISARITEIANYLSEAAERDNAKYKTWGTYVWPNPPIYATPKTYAGIISNMIAWQQGRFKWIELQHTPTPVLSHQGGKVITGTQFTLDSAGNKVLFTLDGTDPRLPGGATNPAALTYDGSPIAVTKNAKIFARGVSSRGWSAPAIASFTVTIPALEVSEIMFHAASAPLGSPYSAEDFSYIELRNNGTETVSLPGFKVSGGISYTFDALSGVTTLAPGERVLIVKNRAAFLSRYPNAAKIAGEYTGTLGNESNRIVLEGPLGEPIADFSYDADWYPATDGNGFSLVRSSNTSANLNTSLAWRPSSQLSGSPGAADAAAPNIPAIVVNELLADPILPAKDAVELYNTTDAPVNITGWFLSDDLGAPRKWVAPAQTVIPAKGYLVIDESKFNTGAAGSFAFGAHGDDVYLFSGDGVNLTGYAHGFHFGDVAQGVTLGRVVTSTGKEEFVAQTQPTLGALNSGPAVGPVVLSEIMYFPPDIGTTNNVRDEFVEIRNTSSQPVALYSSTNGWRLRGGADFHFPAGTTLPANGFALVVNFDPQSEPANLAGFRTKYNVDPAVPVFGPYQGNLSNSGEKISLARPGDVDADTGKVSYLTVDEFNYSDIAQAGTDASGGGASLQRRDLTAFGNDPANWFAAAPTAGFGGSLRVSSIQANINGVKLVFRAESGRAYAVWYRDSLATGGWSKLQDVAAGASRDVEVTDIRNRASRFYQVSAQ